METMRAVLFICGIIVFGYGFFMAFIADRETELPDPKYLKSFYKKAVLLS